MNYLFHGYREMASKREPGDGWHYGPFETREDAEAFGERNGDYFAEWAIVRLYGTD